MHPTNVFPPNRILLNRVPTVPTDFSVFADPSIVQQLDNGQLFFVSQGVPTALLAGTQQAPITSATADGLFVRTIDGGVTPVAVQGSTNKKIRVRFATYKLTATGFALVSAAVRVGFGRVAGAPDLTTTTTVTKGSQIVGESAADLAGAAVPGIGYFVSGTGGNLGIVDIEVTFTNTDAKVVVIEYGGQQYNLTVALA